MKLAALLVVAVLAVPVTAHAHGEMGRAFETGRVSLLTSSRAPLFDLQNMAPGSHSTHSLSVGNNGSVDASLHLDATTRGDTTLLHRLRLRVEELRHGARRRVFAGPLSAIQRIDLGVVSAGDSRMYVFSIRWPRGMRDRPGAAKVDFSWTATTAGDS